MPKIIVTTAYHPTPEMIAQAMALADELDGTYRFRRSDTVAAHLDMAQADRALVVQPDRLVLRDPHAVYFYHPNMLLVRWTNISDGRRDLYLDAAGYGPGDTVLDCTLGFGCEAGLAATAVGETGQVIGLESMPDLAAVTRHGMAHFPLSQTPIRQALGRVTVVTADYATYLKSAADKSVDGIYFDPFFEHRTKGSENSVNPLVHFGDPRPLDLNALIDAKRVARKVVLVKHPWDAEIPEPLVEMRNRVVKTRKGQTAYSVIEPG